MNFQLKKKTRYDIGQANLKIAKNLMRVKPTVPLKEKLDMWNTKNAEIRQVMATTRYGSPKPI